jgi:hypothetical protein
MKHPNCTNGDTFPDEVKVDLHVFGALMLDGVGEVNSADVVAIDKASGGEGLMQLLQQLLQPRSYSNTIGDSSIFGLGAGPGVHGLALGGPGDEAAAKEHSIAESGTPSVGTAGPISISVDDELRRG